jgi:hypothetical protein
MEEFADLTPDLSSTGMRNLASYDENPASNELKKMRRLIILATCGAWLLLTIIDGYRQVSKGIQPPGYGYETELQFQIMVYLLTRFIVLLAILVIVLVLELRFLPKGSLRKSTSHT